MGSVQSGKDGQIHEEGLRAHRDGRPKSMGVSVGMDRQDVAHGWTSESWMGGAGDTWAMGIDVGPDQTNSDGVRGPGRELGRVTLHACMYWFLSQGMDVALQFSSIYPQKWPLLTW